MVYFFAFLGGAIVGCLFTILMMAVLWANGGNDGERDITQESWQDGKHNTK